MSNASRFRIIQSASVDTTAFERYWMTAASLGEHVARTESRHNKEQTAFRSDVSGLLDCETMTVRSMTIPRKHEAYVKAVAQASDGVCCVFSIGCGKLMFAAAKDRAADLNDLVNDLETELASR